MSALPVDQMDDATHWAALEADGVTPSTALAMQDDNTIAGYGADGVAARITAAAGATGHLLRRSLPAAIDVSDLTQLRLSLRADRTAGPRGGGPFFLELRLGSAAVPIAAAANTWHRLLPVPVGSRWSSLKLGIDDLDDAIAGAVTELQLRCVDDDPSFTAHVDDLIAVLPEMLADADRALAARLSGISIGGTALAAAVRAPAQALPSAPALDLTQFDIRYAPDRVRDIVTTGDHTAGGGLRLIPLGDPYDLYYAVVPVAANRAQQALLIEGVVDRLAPYDELHVDGDHLPVEMVRIAGTERVGGAPAPEPAFFLKVGVRRAGATPQSVFDVQETQVEAELLEAR